MNPIRILPETTANRIAAGRFALPVGCVAVDQRVLDAHQVEEISLGDFVLTGGEIAATALPWTAGIVLGPSLRLCNEGRAQINGV
jgi:tRNA G37 N-methylase TrmD